MLSIQLSTSDTEHLTKQCFTVSYKPGGSWSDSITYSVTSCCTLADLVLVVQGTVPAGFTLKGPFITVRPWLTFPTRSAFSRTFFRIWIFYVPVLQIHCNVLQLFLKKYLITKENGSTNNKWNVLSISLKAKGSYMLNRQLIHRQRVIPSLYVHLWIKGANYRNLTDSETIYK